MDPVLKRIKTTSETVFGTNPDERARRWIWAIEKYQVGLTDYLQKRLAIGRPAAEDFVIAFIDRLFNRPVVIRQPLWGYFRIYLAKSLVNFARKRIKSEASVLQKLKMSSADAADFVVNGIFGLELRQVRKALEAGTVDDFLERGVGNDELSPRDVEIWKLESIDHLPRTEIASRCAGSKTPSARAAMPFNLTTRPSLRNNWASPQRTSSTDPVGTPRRIVPPAL